MTQNVERILGRGENLDHLRSKTEDLEATSEHFKTTSQRVAQKFWWKNVKMIVLICVIVFIIILFTIHAIPTESPSPHPALFFRATLHSRCQEGPSLPSCLQEVLLCPPAPHSEAPLPHCLPQAPWSPERRKLDCGCFMGLQSWLERYPEGPAWG
ncbi:uncharacterized protein LOC119867146 isoform X1 [Canis lupus familiaris]|uniref:uncharacterized protein LOC119867146 isoform X1 n=1 Tax=Canis lupus familiaris TaxID=9615 RepID=UPI0018F7DBA4|nr:uncharacterized protein LOC119867146 isoform X1 [Canis lupus familiaris]